jgi:hypothetical protein
MFCEWSLMNLIPALNVFQYANPPENASLSLSRDSVSQYPSQQPPTLCQKQHEMDTSDKSENKRELIRNQ